jgi:hypothetical protein
MKACFNEGSLTKPEISFEYKDGTLIYTFNEDGSFKYYVTDLSNKLEDRSSRFITRDEFLALHYKLSYFDKVWQEVELAVKFEKVRGNCEMTFHKGAKDGKPVGYLGLHVSFGKKGFCMDGKIISAKEFIAALKRGQKHEG